MERLIQCKPIWPVARWRVYVALSRRQIQRYCIGVQRWHRLLMVRSACRDETSFDGTTSTARFGRTLAAWRSAGIATPAYCGYASCQRVASRRAGMLVWAWRGRHVRWGPSPQEVDHRCGAFVRRGSCGSRVPHSWPGVRCSEAVMRVPGQGWDTEERVDSHIANGAGERQTRAHQDEP